MATMKADATAENKPAYPMKVGRTSRLEWVGKKGGIPTGIKVVSKSLRHFSENSLSHSSASRLNLL